VTPSVLTVRCHYCSRFRSPREIIPIGSGGAIMCFHCREWHDRALQDLADNPQPGCGECGVTVAELSARSPNGDCQMYVHPCDGFYKLFCRPCSDAYVPKRVDLYRPTQYGYKKKL